MPNPTLYSNKINSMSAKMLQTKKASEFTPLRQKKDGSQGKLEKGGKQAGSNM